MKDITNQDLLEALTGYIDNQFEAQAKMLTETIAEMLANIVENMATKQDIIQGEQRQALHIERVMTNRINVWHAQQLAIA